MLEILLVENLPSGWQGGLGAGSGNGRPCQRQEEESSAHGITSKADCRLPISIAPSCTRDTDWKTVDLKTVASLHAFAIQEPRRELAG